MEHKIRYGLARARLTLSLIALGTELLKFNPSQPRVPAGKPQGGQWTRIAAPFGIQAGGKWDNGRWDICEEQYELDLKKCPGGGCRQQAMLRMVNCMKGESLAPLNW